MRARCPRTITYAEPNSARGLQHHHQPKQQQKQQQQQQQQQQQEGGAGEGEVSPLVVKTASRITDTIRRTPRWESHLLSLFPSSLVFHPDCVRLVFSSSFSNPLLSLRFFLWLSRHNPNPNITFEPPSALLRSLADAQAWNPALHAIRSTKFVTDAPTLHSLLLRFCDSLAMDQALDLLSSQHPSLPTLPLPAWNATLSASLRAGRTDLFWRFYQLMLRSAVAADASTAGLLIRVLFKDGRLHDAHALLREFASNGILPDVAALTQLVSGFARDGNFGRVSEILHLMIAGGRLPDIFTYHALIRGLWDNGMGEEAMRVCNELRIRGYAPDCVTYSTMIDGMCKMGRLDDAWGLWREMLRSGVKPNEYTYNAMVNGYCKSGNLERAREVYVEMIARGFRESTITCNTMIAGLCFHGRMDDALVMFDDMPKRDIEHDVITYNTIIKGFCKNGKVDEAQSHYRQMLAKGIEPSVSTYTPMIQAFCEKGRMVDAVEMMKDMVQVRGLEPLVCSHDHIIQGFCKLGKVEEGLAWFLRMFEGKMKPQAQTLNLLVECLSSVGRVDDAFFVLNVMLRFGYSLGEAVSHQLVNGLCGDTGEQARQLLLLEEILLGNSL